MLEILDSYLIINLIQYGIPIFILVKAFFIWLEYGKKYIINQKKENYNDYSILKNYNPIEIGFFYNGKITMNSIVALLINFANMGYIKIQRMPQNTSGIRKKSFKIIQLKEYKGNNPFEKIFMEGLFPDGREEVSDKDLYNNFYRTIYKIKSYYNNRKIKEKIFDTKSLAIQKRLTLFLWLFVFIRLLPPTFAGDNLGLRMLVVFLLSIVISVLCYCVFSIMINMLSKFKGLKKLFGTMSFYLINAAIILASIQLLPIFFFNRESIASYLISLLIIALLIILIKIVPTRSMFGQISLELLSNFRNEIEAYDISKQVFLKENPVYFYNWYMNAYSMGWADRFVKDYELLDVEKPFWYNSLDGREINIRTIDETIRDIQKAMTFIYFNNAPTVFMDKVQNAQAEKRKSIYKREQLAVLGELSEGVMHDINNPISTINTSILLLESYANSEDEKEILSNMKTSTEKVINIVNSMRNQIRNLESEVKESFDLNDIVKDLHILTQNEQKKNNCKFESRVEDNIFIYGEKIKMSQVLTNIVINGIQAYGQNNKKGKVILTATKRTNDYCRIEIEDEAGGIPLGVQKTLFKKVVTTKGQKGTGLGLYMANNIITKDFYGTISFEVKNNIGTKFIIKVPMSDEISLSDF